MKKIKFAPEKRPKPNYCESSYSYQLRKVFKQKTKKTDAPNDFGHILPKWPLNLWDQSRDTYIPY